MFTSSCNSTTYVLIELCQRSAKLGKIACNSFSSPRPSTSAQICKYTLSDYCDCKRDDRRFPTFIFCTGSTTLGIGQCMFLWDFVNASRSWANLHDTHFPTLSLRPLPRIDDHTLPDNFDCKWHGHDSSLFCCSHMVINVWNSSVLVLVRFRQWNAFLIETAWNSFFHSRT